VFVSMRTYKGCPDVAALSRRVKKQLVTNIQNMKGFHSYTVVDLGEGTALSISVFATRANAEAANKKVRELVKEGFLDLAPNPPAVVVGKVLSETRA
jgi:hypothetical protein